MCRGDLPWFSYNYDQVILHALFSTQQVVPGLYFCALVTLQETEIRETCDKKG